jgi:CHASE3 domain sensor protein
VAAERSRLPRALTRLRVAQLVGLATIVPVVVIVIAVVIGIITLSNLASVRNELVNRVEPANAAGLTLATALLDQETGIRGYELSADSTFLEPYQTGREAQQQALATLRRTNVPGTSEALATVIANVDEWDRRVAQPAIRGVTPGHPRATANVDAVLGKQLFDMVRSSLAVLQYDINHRLTHVKDELTVA